jgi:hypothetical protein
LPQSRWRVSRMESVRTVRVITATNTRINHSFSGRLNHINKRVILDVGGVIRFTVPMPSSPANNALVTSTRKHRRPPTRPWPSVLIRSPRDTLLALHPVRPNFGGKWLEIPQYRATSGHSALLTSMLGVHPLWRLRSEGQLDRPLNGPIPQMHSSMLVIAWENLVDHERVNQRCGSVLHWHGC